jgi:hypothetical protein
MKYRSILLIAFLLHSIVATSQCDDAKLGVDKFTGDTLFSNRVKCATLSRRFNLDFIKMKGAYYFQVEYSTSGFKAIVLGATDSLHLKLSSGEVLKLAPVGLQTGSHKTSGSYSYTTIDALYYCQESDLEKLAASNLVMMRIYFSTSIDTVEFKEKQYQEIRQAASCIKTKRK